MAMPPTRTLKTVAAGEDKKKRKIKKERDGNEGETLSTNTDKKIIQERLNAARLARILAGISQKPRYIVKPERGVVNFFSGRTYFENRLGAGVWGMYDENNKKERKEIAMETIRYVHEAGEIGESWSNARYAVVMKKESEGNYDELEPESRAIKMFTDILFGFNVDQDGNDTTPVVWSVADWQEGFRNFNGNIRAQELADQEVKPKRTVLLNKLVDSGIKSMRSELGINETRWISRSLLHSIVPHVWNRQFQTSPLPHLPEPTSKDTEVLADAIQVSQDDIDQIGRTIIAMNEDLDEEHNDHLAKVMIDDIHRLTGNGLSYSDTTAAEYKAERDAGKRQPVAWATLQGFWSSLAPFFEYDQEVDDSDYDEDDNESDRDIDNEVPAEDKVMVAAWIERWNERGDEVEKQGKGFSFKRRVLNKRLGKIGK